MQFPKNRIHKLVFFAVVYVGLAIAFNIAVGDTNDQVLDKLPATLFGGAVAGAFIWFDSRSRNGSQ